MIDLPYPNINGETDDKKIAQIQNYLIQLKDILEFTLMSMSSENMAMSEALAKGLNESNVVREDHMSQVSSKMTSEADSTMSAIQQTADNIMIEVGKKTSVDDVRAIINMNANGEIEILGNKISIDSNNFDLTKEGKVTAKDITITGGSIEIDNGSDYNKASISVKARNANYSTDISGLGVHILVDNRFADFYSGGMAMGRMENGVPINSMHINSEEIWIDYLSVFEDLNVDGDTYLSSAPIVGSDRELKEEIAELDAKKTSDFIYSLKPCEYKYKGKKRLHHGFIAQEVKESMGEDDWGVYVDGEKHKALRYEEIIADLVATVQSQNERIKQLEQKL